MGIESVAMVAERLGGDLLVSTLREAIRMAVVARARGRGLEGPHLALAWSSVMQFKTPCSTGKFAASWTCISPMATAVDVVSKCMVSPFIKTPKHICGISKHSCHANTIAFTITMHY